MALEMNENVCYNIPPGTVMKNFARNKFCHGASGDTYSGVTKRNVECENINIKILRRKIHHLI